MLCHIPQFRLVHTVVHFSLNYYEVDIISWNHFSFSMPSWFFFFFLRLVTEYWNCLEILIRIPDAIKKFFFPICNYHFYWPYYPYNSSIILFFFFFLQRACLSIAFSCLFNKEFSSTKNYISQISRITILWCKMRKHH